MFEGHFLKFGKARVGPNCKLGEHATVQRGATLGRGTCVGPLSLVIQNEVTQVDSCYIGHVGFPISLPLTPGMTPEGLPWNMSTTVQTNPITALVDGPVPM